VLPDTLLGLVLFTAAAGPGYLYVRLSQVREPRYERTTLEEAVEFVVFGALASGVAVLAALSFGELTGLLDTKQLADGPRHYITTEPVRALAALVLVLGVTYGLVWLVTTKLLHRDGADIRPGETGWYAAFHRFLPADHGVYGTVQLRDGRAIAGLIVAYSIEADESREIVLSKPPNGPLWLRTPEGRSVELEDTFIVLEGPDIYAVSGRYTRLKSTTEPATG
jgi:Family of unknown function (DUF6338)